jgi:hypothetical protein
VAEHQRHVQSERDRVSSNAPAETTSVYGPKKSYIS